MMSLEMKSPKLSMAQRLELWRASKEQQQQQQNYITNGASRGLSPNNPSVLSNRKSLSATNKSTTPSSSNNVNTNINSLSVGKRKTLNSPKGQQLIDFMDVDCRSNDEYDNACKSPKSPYSEKSQGNSPLNIQKNKQRRKSIMLIHDRGSYGQNQNRDPNIMDSAILFNAAMKVTVDNNNNTPNTLLSNGKRLSPNSALSDRLNITLDDGYITANEHAPYDDYYDSDSRSSIGSNRPSSIGSPWINSNSKSNVVTSRTVLGKLSQGSSPSAAATIHRAAMQQARDEIDSLREKVFYMEEQLRQSEIARNCALNTERQQSIRLEMAIEEINSLTFYNALQDQKIIEMEQSISLDRMEHNENNSNRSRKHKAEIKVLKAEREEYEEKANQMIQQMSEQMTLLQTMAMGRIEELEKELLTERRKNETFLAETKENTRPVAKYSAIQKKYSAAVEHEDDDDEDDDNEEDSDDGNSSDENEGSMT